jgi:hypothetical protein
LVIDGPKKHAWLAELLYIYCSKKGVGVRVVETCVKKLAVNLGDYATFEYAALPF